MDSKRVRCCCCLVFWIGFFVCCTAECCSRPSRMSDARASVWESFIIIITIFFWDSVISSSLPTVFSNASRRKYFSSIHIFMTSQTCYSYITMHSSIRSVNWNETFITFLRRWYCYFNSATCLGLLFFLLGFFSLFSFIQCTLNYYGEHFSSSSSSFYGLFGFFHSSVFKYSFCLFLFFRRHWRVESKFSWLASLSCRCHKKNCTEKNDRFSCLWEPNELGAFGLLFM